MPKEKIIRPCALCYETKELEESHIIPKFVYRHLKNTSVGNIRSSHEPNLVIQDSEKHYMLCKDCEDKFNKVETAFANQIFYPYQNEGKEEFYYDDWLHYFIVSVNWRFLYYRLADFLRDGDIELDSLEVFLESEKTLRDYLMNRRPDIGNIENHMFFHGDIKEASEAYKDGRPHVTFRRGSGGTTYYYPDLNEYATYSNLMGIMIITLYRKNNDAIWKNTQIFCGSNYIKASNQNIQSMFAQELRYDVEDLDNVALSEKQQNKIIDSIKRNPEEFMNSKFYQEYLKDKKL